MTNEVPSNVRPLDDWNALVPFPNGIRFAVRVASPVPPLATLSGVVSVKLGSVCPLAHVGVPATVPERVGDDSVGDDSVLLVNVCVRSRVLLMSRSARMSLTSAAVRCRTRR